jgi:mRNA-degrading endonuclease RelE of RelBE toxin-antitoxin system
MRTKVNVASQVEDFVKSLAPEPRRRLRMAIKALAKDRGDIKRLEGGLEGYSRLRISGHRVIFAERAERGERIIDCVFAEKRSVVYELFLRLLSEGLVGQ